MAEYVTEWGESVADFTVREEIVRCKDCEHFAVDQSDHEYRSGWWCKWWNTDIARPDTFCAWGRRADG